MTRETMPIESIGLSVRSQNALHREGIHTVAAFLELTEERLYSIRNLGVKSVQEILTKQADLRAISDDAPEEGASGNREVLLTWLQEKELRLEEVELLPGRALNVLFLAGYEYIHQQTW